MKTIEEWAASPAPVIKLNLNAVIKKGRLEVLANGNTVAHITTFPSYSAPRRIFVDLGAMAEQDVRAVFEVFRLMPRYRVDSPLEFRPHASRQTSGRSDWKFAICPP